jgi:P-type Ca2+ transporter type 2C
VNDAPALAASDIGIAMGVTGTEVAKNAADMVLADDSFSSIVAAVEEGRSMYGNLQSMISYLVSCNMGEIACIVLSSAAGFPEPLTPLHLLWANLATDGPPATALSFNPAESDIMSRAPRKRSDPIISRRMLIKYAISSSYEAVATIAAFVWWYLDKGVTISQLRNWQSCTQWPGFAHPALAPYPPCGIFSSLRYRAQSVSLSVLLLIEMIKALSSISKEKSLFVTKPWTNPALVGAIGFSLMLHLLAMYTPFLSKLLSISPLSVVEWKVFLTASHCLLLTLF